MPEAHEAAGSHMQQAASDKFLRVERHGLETMVLTTVGRKMDRLVDEKATSKEGTGIVKVVEVLKKFNIKATLAIREETYMCLEERVWAVQCV